MIEWRWIILVRAIGHTTESRGTASRFHGINHPSAACRFLSSCHLEDAFFSAFYNLVAGLLSTFSKARTTGCFDK